MRLALLSIGIVGIAEWKLRSAAAIYLNSHSNDDTFNPLFAHLCEQHIQCVCFQS